MEWNVEGRGHLDKGKWERIRPSRIMCWFRLWHYILPSANAVCRESCVVRVCPAPTGLGLAPLKETISAFVLTGNSMWVIQCVGVSGCNGYCRQWLRLTLVSLSKWFVNGGLHAGLSQRYWDRILLRTPSIISMSCRIKIIWNIRPIIANSYCDGPIAHQSLKYCNMVRWTWWDWRLILRNITSFSDLTLLVGSIDP